MNQPQTVLTPHRTAKNPQIEFVVVNDMQKEVDRLLTEKPIVVEDVTTNKHGDTTRQIQPTIIDDNKTDYVIQVHQAIEASKPFVKFVANQTTKIIRVSGYVIGFVVVKSVKYAFIFTGALIGGLVMAVVDLFNYQETESDYSHDDERQIDEGWKGGNFNNSTINNSTINIQNNYR